MSRRYAPGAWFGAVSAQGVALLPADLDLDLVEGVWERLGRGKGLGGVLEALTGAFGTSLSAIPPFAVVLGTSEQARLAVRGPLTVSVRVRSGEPVVVSGLGVTTWSERVIDNPVEIELLVDGAPAVERWFPLADGVALVSGIRLPLANVGHSPAPVAPVSAPAVPTAPAATPEPAPQTRTPEPAPVRAPAVAPVTAVPSFAAPVPTSAPTSEPEEEPASEPASPVADNAVNDAAHDVPGDAAHDTQHEASDETWMPPVETAVPSPSTTTPAAVAPATNPFQQPHAEVDEYDHLWGATVVKPVAEAAVRPDPEPETDTQAGAVPTPTVEGAAPADHLADHPGDHDGETISFDQAQALRGGLSSSPQTAPLERPAPPRGRIVLSTGREVELDRSVVIGRRPRAVRVTGGILPHLIAVDSPQQDISRSHVEIRTEGDAVLVVDLDTTNGTVLIREGAPPVRLHPGEPSIVIDGDVIDLGDDVTVTFRGIG